MGRPPQLSASSYRYGSPFGRQHLICLRANSTGRDEKVEQHPLGGSAIFTTVGLDLENKRFRKRRPPGCDRETFIAANSTATLKYPPPILSRMGLLPFETETRTVLTRRHAETSPKYGKRPEERTMKELLDFGIVAIDKPAGPSSHQVSSYVMKILEAKKAGHSGTLDPHVTGVLPVALGNGTRVVQSLLTAGKEYVTLMHIHKEVDEQELRRVLAEFTGKITQLPPVKSAVKRQERERTIYYIELLEIEGQDVLFTAGTQAGTYIRKLCHDIGMTMKKDGQPVGAHMAELRRSKAGPFGEQDLVTLQDLADAFHYWKEGDETPLRKAVLPAERGVSHLKKVWVMDSTVESLCQGIQLKVPGIAKLHDTIVPGEPVAVMTLKDEVILVGEAALTSDDMLKDKGVAVRTRQVFMRPGTYPKNADVARQDG